jgi:large subunit ribosomal protein L32
MGVPKRKSSKRRSRLRRHSHVVTLPRLVPCPHCHGLRPAHRICPLCGFYRGAVVIQAEEKKA